MINFLTSKVRRTIELAQMGESYQVLEDAGFFRTDSEEINTTDDYFRVLRDNAGDKILTFDTECISNDSDYAGLVHSFFDHANLTQHLSDVSSELTDTGTAKLSFKIDNTEYKKEWAQASDYIEGDFLGFIDDALQEKLNTSVFVLPAEDQCAEVIFVPKDVSSPVEEYFDFVYKKDTPDYRMDHGLIATLILGILVIIISAIIGYSLSKFWLCTFAGIGIAIVLWIWQSVVLKKAVDDAEALQELHDADPAEFGKLIGQAALEEMKRLSKK